jgi:hypothetical protein
VSPCPTPTLSTQPSPHLCGACPSSVWSWLCGSTKAPAGVAQLRLMSCRRGDSWMGHAALGCGIHHPWSTLRIRSRNCPKGAFYIISSARMNLLNVLINQSVHIYPVGPEQICTERGWEVKLCNTHESGLVKTTAWRSLGIFWKCLVLEFGS